MGRDESGTLTALKAHRRELIDPKIAEYGGRIVKTTGDGLLLEFPSVVEAVRCAVDVQRGMAQRNAGMPVDQRVDFRVGVNVGDIIIDDDDIFGDGVNVAARLQALAEPGEICVSKVVRDQVLDKLSFAFEDLGSQRVKNIARPIEAYRVDLGGEASTASTGLRPWKRLRRSPMSRWVAVGIAAIGLVGIASWMLPQFSKTNPVLSSPLPAVAVLPFVAPGSGSDEEQFADTLTRDLTSVLGRVIRPTRVISQDLAAPYKAKSVDARGVGRDLNATYLVEGEVRRIGEHFQVNVQLVETAGATQVWSDHLEFDSTKLSGNQATPVSRLAARVESAIFDANMRRFAGVPPSDASPVELFWHATSVWYRDNNTVRGALEARKWFDQALRVDPSFVPAILGRWRTLQYALELDPNADTQHILQEMDELSFRVISIDNTNPTAWIARTDTLTRQGRLEAALEANAKAEKLALATGWAINQRAGIMILTGQPQEALTLIDRQVALHEPQDQEELGWVMLQRCRAYMALGRYQEAIDACERDIALDNWWLPHLYLVAGYALTGKDAKAAAERVTLLQLRSGTSIADFKKLYYSDNAAFVQQTESHLLAGLRKAGLPEH
jgi:TolB-like protein